MNPPARTRIKICGLTREADVHAAVEAGADALGFVLYPPSPRYVSPERAAALAALLPPWVTPVLLFVDAAPVEVARAAGRVPGAMLQFHGDESPAQCWAASLGGRWPWLRAARIPPGADAARFDLLEFAARHAGARGILLDALVPGYGGAGTSFEWSQLPPSVDAHLVLSGGLTPANVAEGMAAVRPRGRSLAVDVSSGVEAEGRKGIKDPEKIRRFVAAVRAADAVS